MSATTSIQWTDRTWNPVRGCSLVSPGCKNCYAMKFAHRFAAPGKPYAGLTRLGNTRPVWTGEVRTVPEALAEPLRWRKPSRVFVNSMSDLFHKDVPNEFIAAVFGVMAAAPQHTFQILTKRAERLPEWFAWVDKEIADWRRLHGVTQGADICASAAIRVVPPPWAPFMRASLNAKWPLPNVWLGVSVEDQARADERIPHLLRVPAAVRFLSVEPMLGPVDLRVALGGNVRWDSTGREVGRDTIAWVIVGGESGPGARPLDLEWAQALVKQCKAARVACFVKQLGAFVVDGGRTAPRDMVQWDGPVAPNGEVYAWRWRGSDPKGGDPEDWPSDLRVREFPGVTP